MRVRPVRPDEAARLRELRLRPLDTSTAVSNAMWVAPEARRRGIGRALPDACAHWASERGFDAVQLNVGVANAVARAAYDAAGFALEREDGDELVLKRALV